MLSHNQDDISHLKFLKKIGKGGFGQVYQVYDTVKEEHLAVKKITKSLIKSTKIEPLLMQSLQHPNIIRFKQSFQTKSNLYLVMELAEGGSLRQLMKEKRQENESIGEEEASQIMFNLLKGVEYMHSKNIIHRDLKPENILFRSSRNVNSLIIADFGLGFQFEDQNFFLKTVSQKCGTYFYMAPEQIASQSYSKPVDLWACGIIMFMLLTNGKHPLADSKLAKEDYEQVLRRDFEIEMPKQISNLAQNLLKNLLKRNSTGRYSAGQALLHPWITGNYSDEIPMNLDDRKQVFEQKIRLSYKLKSLLLLIYIRQVTDTKNQSVNRTLNDRLTKQSLKTLPSKIETVSLSPVLKSQASSFKQFKINLKSIQQSSTRFHSSVHETSPEKQYSNFKLVRHSKNRSQVLIQLELDKYLNPKNTIRKLTLPKITYK